MNRQYVDISHFRAPYKNWPYLGIGESPTATVATQAMSPVKNEASSIWSTISKVLALGTSMAGAYHGYKRNGDSIGWGFGWFLLGGAWPIAIPVMFAQGFAKPKYKTVAVANKRMPPLSQFQLRRLLVKAEESGDVKTATLCKKAFRGDKKAKAACRRMINAPGRA